MKKAFFIYAKMNPPTKTWETIIRELYLLLNRNGDDLFIMLSPIVDKKDNLLLWSEKVSIVSEMLKGPHVITDKAIRSPNELIDYLFSSYDNVVWVVGNQEKENNLREFKNIINKKWIAKGKTLELNHLQYDPDLLEIGLVPYTARMYAKSGNFASFIQTMPSGLSNKTIREIFDKIKNRHHIKL